jgi:hypothetical protein
MDFGGILLCRDYGTYKKETKNENYFLHGHFKIGMENNKSLL